MICICKEGGEEKLKNLKNILNYIVLITVLFTGVMGKTQCAEAKIYDGDKLKIVTLTGKVVKHHAIAGNGKKILNYDLILNKKINSCALFHIAS